MYYKHLYITALLGFDIAVSSISLNGVWSHLSFFREMTRK